MLFLKTNNFSNPTVFYLFLDMHSGYGILRKIMPIMQYYTLYIVEPLDFTKE